MGFCSYILLSFPSGGELLLVVLVILLLFGADKIPEFARMFGKGMREVKKATEDIKREFNDETRELRDEIEKEKADLTDKIHKFKEELKEDHPGNKAESKPNTQSKPDA